jgi:lysophospholipase L1-like esterase
MNTFIKAMKNLSLTFGITVLIITCKPEIEMPIPSAGGVDLSNYVALGNSLTAGYQDGGLYLEGQEQSFPAILAGQIREVNPGLMFNQPAMPENGSGYLKLKSLDLANQLFQFEQIPPDPGWTDRIPGTYQNLGITGMRVRDITVNGYGANPEQGNPYFYRILSENEAAKSYLDKVGEAEVSIYTSWLGSNDVLDYAISGGAFGPDGLPVTGINGLTPVDEFEASYDALINVLESKGAKGILGTVPDVGNIPFFNAIPWNSIVLDEASAALANGFYASQIDTLIEAGVEEALINLVATDTVVKVYVIPDLADTTVWLQTYQAALADGKTPQEAADSAYAFLNSPVGQAASALLQTALGDELILYLSGFPVTPQLLPLFNQIGLLIATDPTLQAGILQAEGEIRQAYGAGYLPELEQQVESQTQAQIDGLKAAGIYPTFEAGANGFVIEVPVTETNPLGIRQMVESEKILFFAFLILADPEAALAPQPDGLILTNEELDSIRAFTEDYNEIIRGYESANIGILDADEILSALNNGAFLDGTEVDGSYIQGGVFSLDAIHLTPRGYAIVANAFIGAINSKFASSIPPVNTSTYRAVVLP